MTPEQEDALIEIALSQVPKDSSDPWADHVRLSIRAAVAAERERCARIALDPDYSPEGIAAAQEARDQALAIARELARLATCMDAIPQGSIGTQVDKLRLLEERIARETEFDNATRNA